MLPAKPTKPTGFSAGQSQFPREINGIVTGLPSELLVVPTFIKGKRFEALVDSGSMVNLISENLMESLGLTPTNKERLVLRSYQGNPESTLGSTILPIEIGNDTYLLNAHVAKHIPYPIFIGIPFLKTYKAKLDLSRKILDLPNAEIKVKGRGRSDLTCNVISPGDSSEELYICCSEKKKTLSPGEVAKVKIQPPTATKLITSKPGSPWVLQEGLVNSATQELLLINNTSENQEITPGDIVGQQESITGVYALSSEQATIQDRPGNQCAQVRTGKNGPAYQGSVEKSMDESRKEEIENQIEFKKLVQEKTEHLIGKEREILQQLLHKFRAVFAVKNDKLGFNNRSPLQIDYSGPKFYKKPYRIPIAKEKAVEEEIAKMMTQGVIRKSTSPYSSPLLVVGKKDGTMRLCIDYRTLNLNTKKDRFPLPAIDEILAKLGGATSYTTLDCQSGYWQLSMAQESIEKTAFSTPSGHYEFLVVPFGLSNAPSHFQRLMSHLMSGLVGKACFVFIDDILVYGPNFPHHIRHLEAVLHILYEENLKLKFAKCNFLRQRLNFLGHVVTPQGIQPQEDKVLAIRNSPRPLDKTMVKSFLGLASYYRKFITGFAALAKPLHQVSTKEKFEWQEEQEKAWNSLKKAVTSDSLLAHPNFEKRFILTTDASNNHYGCVLSQMDEKNYDRPILFISKSFTPGERKLSTYEQEFLALNYSLKKLRQYLLGHPVLWRTDNHALTYLQKMTMKEPNGRIARWVLNLLEFDLEIEHVKGKSNRVADYLSRIPWANGSQINLVYEKANLNHEAFKKHQQKDRELSAIREHLLNSEADTFTVECGTWKGFRAKLHDNILHQEVEGIRKILVPPKLREQLILRCHQSNNTIHPGRMETLRVVQQNYLWPQMAHEVNRVVDQCDRCLRNKANVKPKVDSMPMQRGKEVWSLLHLDLVGPLQVTTRGHRYILSVVDSFSKYICLRALVDKSANEVVNKFTTLMNQYGTPEKVVTDNGKEFIAEKMEKLLKYYNVKHHTTAAYHPEANGKVERTNRDLMIKIRIITEELNDEWDILLPTVEMALNNRQHRGTRVPPFLLMFGRTPRLPMNIFKLDNQETDEVPVFTNEDDFFLAKRRTAREVVQQVERNLQKYERSFESKGLEKEENPVDGIIYLDIPLPGTNKMSPRYLGPYVVIRKITPVTYEVENAATGTRKIVHRSCIRKNVDAVDLPNPVVTEEKPESQADSSVENDSDSDREFGNSRVETNPRHIDSHRLNARYNLRNQNKPISYEE